MAIGHVSARRSITTADALALLRAIAFTTATDLQTIADRILTGELPTDRADHVVWWRPRITLPTWTSGRRGSTRWPRPGHGADPNVDDRLYAVGHLAPIEGEMIELVRATQAA